MTAFSSGLLDGGHGVTKQTSVFKSKTNTQTQYTATKIGNCLAITPQHQAHRVKLPKQLAPYIAPHSQTPAVSRANERDGGSRTYARVPLYLRGKTLDINDTPKRPEVRNNSSIADSDKTILDNSAIFRGRKIHTFARFVQMVHAIVARNDIYGGTNRILFDCTFIT